MTRRLVASVVCAVVVAGCGGGDSELRDLAAETCVVLSSPETTLADASLVLFEATGAALRLGYTEEEFADALRDACPTSVIIGGES